MADLSTGPSGAEEAIPENTVNGALPVTANNSVAQADTEPQVTPAQQQQVENSQAMLGQPIASEAPVVQQQISAGQAHQSIQIFN